MLGKERGGPIPGPEGQPIPIMAHGGEFMLSANVVNAIKAGRTTDALPGGGALSGGGVSITQNITLQGGGTQDIGELCRAIGDATRNGLRQAGEMANVITKVGTKKAGVTAL